MMIFQIVWERERVHASACELTKQDAESNKNSREFISLTVHRIVKKSVRELDWEQTRVGVRQELWEFKFLKNTYECMGVEDRKRVRVDEDLTEFDRG